ncbi:lipopolysaccharide biosynthesis protein [bacterium]|nr:lipopolysaccharide biosynthesis protein [bacterium]
MTVRARSNIFGSFVLAGGRVLGALFQFFIIIQAAKYLSIENSGEYLRYLTWMNVAIALGQFGYVILAQRLIARFKEHSIYSDLRVTGILSFVLLISSIFGSLFGIIISYYGDLRSSIYLIVFCSVIWVIGGAVSQVAAELLRVKNKFIPSAITVITGPMLICLSVLAGNYFHLIESIASWVIVSSISFLFSTLISLHFILKTFPVGVGQHFRVIRVGFRFGRRLIHDAYRSLFTSLGGVAFSQIDLWILSITLKADEFAIYAIGARFAQLVSFFSAISNPIVTPIITRKLINDGLKTTQQFLFRYNIFATILGIIFFAALLTFGKFLFLYLFGRNFADAGVIGTILCIPAILNLCTGPKGYLLWLLGNDFIVLKFLTISSIAIAVACFITGSSGSLVLIAAFVSSIQVLYFFCEIVLLRRLVGLRVFHGLIK